MTDWMTRQQGFTNKWQDWINLLLSIWLFVSPWVLGFHPGGAVESVPAAWAAWILAVVIAVFSIAALAKAQPWEEWINLIAGALLFISPWVLGFYPATPRRWGMHSSSAPWSSFWRFGISIPCRRLPGVALEHAHVSTIRVLATGVRTNNRNAFRRARAAEGQA